MTPLPSTFSGHLRATLTLGLPLIGGHLAQQAIGLTDTVMMGWYGVQELAVLTLASMSFFVFFFLLSGFGWAVMPMVASAIGAGDDTQARRATRMGLWISCALAVLAQPVFWFSDPLLRALGQEPALTGLAQDYLRIAGFGLIPALGVVVLKSYLAALERARMVLWVTVVSAIVNALVNYALIFGNWGAPELGVRGAAIASVLSHLSAFVVVAIYVARAFPEHAVFVRFWRPDSEAMSQVFRLGWPIGLTNLAEGALFSASALFMGLLGTLPLAAHGIAIQLASATFVIHMGLSNAATVRAGRAHGRRDPPGLRLGAQAAISASLMVSLVTIAVFLGLPEPLIDLFLSDDDPERSAILGMGTGFLAMAALFQLVDGAQVLALGLLRGLQDTRVPMWMAAFAYWAVGLPAIWICGFVLDGGAMGIWAGLVIGLTVAAALLMWRFWRVCLPVLGAQGVPG